MSTKLKPTTILRVNPGMLRDAWLETDASNNTVLVIRQVKFSDGGSAEIKLFRLVADEIDALRAVMDEGIKDA